MKDNSRVVLDTNQVCRLLRKTPMTIYRYRHREKDPLPFFQIETSLKSSEGAKAPVRFYMDEILSWSRRNNLPSYSLSEDRHE